MGLHRGHQARPLERAAEWFIFAVSTSAILMIFLIFIFIGRAALPIVLGQMNSSLVQDVIPPEDMGKLSREELRAYLGLTKAEFAGKDEETLRLLMEIKVEMAAEAPDDKDAGVNTTSWRYLLQPYRWTGYEKPENHPRRLALQRSPGARRGHLHFAARLAKSPRNGQAHDRASFRHSLGGARLFRPDCPGQRGAANLRVGVAPERHRGRHRPGAGGDPGDLLHF
jgi:hypothetical protein